MDELKPCPWCGEKAILTKMPENCCISKANEKTHYMYYVKCRICGANAPNGIMDDVFCTPEEATQKAINIWNKRANENEWERMKPGTMPEINGPRFLLIRGVHDTDGGILCVARCVQYQSAPFIHYIGGENGWKELPESEYSECLWQEVELPRMDRS